jgi:hypothetical protein
VISPRDEHPHPVAPQAFQTWKENWCLCAVDPVRGVSAVFHVSLRPVDGEAIFSGKLRAGEREHKHVRRQPIGPDPRALEPLSDGAMTLELGDSPRITLETEEVTASLEFTGRFGVFDFADGPLAPGESALGEIGRHVFPFHHYEQGLDVRGSLTLASGETIEVHGRGNRDHSWGFRDDFGFRRHHWICANFDDRFIGGSAMVETSYDGLKHGGAVASAAGHDPIVHVDESGAYWLQEGEPLPQLDRDVSYRLTTASGAVHTVVAHVAEPYALLYLNAKSADRSQLYQDRQVFCDYTLVETGARGCGVLELGKYLSGPGVADRHGRRVVSA